MDPKKKMHLPAETKANDSYKQPNFLNFDEDFQMPYKVNRRKVPASKSSRTNNTANLAHNNNLSISFIIMKIY